MGAEGGKWPMGAELGPVSSTWGVGLLLALG